MKFTVEDPGETVSAAPGVYTPSVIAELTTHVERRCGSGATALSDHPAPSAKWRAETILPITIFRQNNEQMGEHS